LLPHGAMRTSVFMRLRKRVVTRKATEVCYGDWNAIVFHDVDEKSLYNIFCRIVSIHSFVVLFCRLELRLWQFLMWYRSRLKMRVCVFPSLTGVLRSLRCLCSYVIVVWTPDLGSADVMLTFIWEWHHVIV
jgi:hypothetical protein